MSSAVGPSESIPAGGAEPADARPADDARGTTGRRPRAVLLVANQANPYSRALRVARSLAADGYEVEIAALAGEAPTREADGDIEIRRYAPSGPWARWGGDGRRDAAGQDQAERGRGLTGRLGALLRRGPRGLLELAAKIVFWPLAVRGWWHGLRSAVAPADLYHAFGILSIGVALELARSARRSGRAGMVVYDVIDVILESNNYSMVPGPILAWYRWRERRWVRRSDLIVTVNAPIAGHLSRIWALGEPPTVLLNCQPRATIPDPRPDLIRAATGIPAHRRIVLFLGRLGRERGLDEAARAVLELDDTALVVIGFGPWAERLRERDRDPRYAGRHFTLPPVHPDALADWTASADVSIIAVPANSLNQRLSTPNKFWESLTAGTPVVVGRDLTVMRAIVEESGLGAIADLDSLGSGLNAVLGLPDAELRAMRERCLEVTRTRYNWETAVQPYLGAVRRLTGSTGEGRR